MTKAERREKQRGYSDAHAQKNIDAGLCTSCGEPNDNDKSFRCKACLGRQAAAKRATSAERLAAGLCVDCGGSREGSTRARHCVKCTKRMRASSKKKRAMWRVQGKCATCKGPSDGYQCGGCLSLRRSPDGKPKPWKFWTDRELAAAKEMAEEGVTAAIIGKRLGRTTVSVWHKLWGEGVKMRPAPAFIRGGDDDEIPEFRPTLADFATARRAE